MTRLFRALCPCALLLVLLSGCRDADHPAAVLLGEESRTALLLRPELPTLPDLSERAGLGEELGPAVQRWVESWEGRPDDELRADVYAEVVEPLARSLGAGGVADARASLGTALEAVERVRASDIPAELQTNVERARHHHAEAGEALAGGRESDALAGVLQGADALREVGPEGVARVLIRRAEGALDATAEGPGTPPVDIERADRMLQGARVALEGGDWQRALRRAYYACQLLGVATH